MKNILKKIKLFVERSLERDSVLFVLSVVLAFFIWAYIANSKFPDKTIYFNDVAIDYEASIAGTPAEAEGYKIYDPDMQTADIKVKANRRYESFLHCPLFFSRSLLADD